MIKRIQDIDNNQPNEQQLLAIQESCCIHCKNKFNKDHYITFVELHNGKIIWWHNREKTMNCKKIKDENKKIKKPKILNIHSFEDFCNECDIKKLYNK